MPPLGGAYQNDHENFMKKVKKQNKNPLVSVIMPVYNAGDYIVPAIESILNQSYANIELIIVNDASTDDSLMIIKSYQKQLPEKISLINLSNNLNKGGDSCANLAIEQAKGKYIAKMDADDIAYPDRIKMQVDYLESHPRTYLVGSQAYVIDKKGEIIGNKTEPLSYKEIYNSYLTFHPIIHPTAMYRRMIPKKRNASLDSSPAKRVQNDKVFQYKVKYSANNDYYTFFSLICKGYKFANLPEKLLYYRIHGKNDTFVHMKEKFMNTLKIRLLMVSKYGYKPTLKQVAISLIQLLTMAFLPEKFTTYLYLLTKGIIKKEEVVKHILTFPKLLLLKVQNAQA